MKKTIILALALVASVSAFAQTKVKQATKDTAKVKPAYAKFVKLAQPNDFNTLIEFVTRYKDAIIWNPNITADQKVQAQQSIELYLKELGNRVQLDSVAVKK